MEGWIKQRDYMTDREADERRRYFIKEIVPVTRSWSWSSLTDARVEGRLAHVGRSNR